MYCYVITNKVTGKQYVGISKHPPEVRFRGHRQRAGAGAKTALHAAMRHYGVENFTVDCIGQAHSRAQLSNLERSEILKRRTQHPQGYNLTDGGDGCRKLSKARG